MFWLTLLSWEALRLVSVDSQRPLLAICSHTRKDQFRIRMYLWKLEVRTWTHLLCVWEGGVQGEDEGRTIQPPTVVACHHLSIAGVRSAAPYVPGGLRLSVFVSPDRDEGWGGEPL